MAERLNISSKNFEALSCRQRCSDDNFKMGKFVPRQRKHKVLARQKRQHESAEQVIDTNAVEVLPAAKAELEEKKRLMKEELQAQGTKVSGKKAKRLEKYIENKLKKDENRELIAQLAKSRTDTTLYQSSRKLGQGHETKRERLARALRDSQAGIDIDGDNEELLFEKRTVSDTKEEPSKDEAQHESIGLFKSPAVFPIHTPQITAGLGMGLKRPLEVDDDGKPVLKKRKRRGGIKSKVSLYQEASEAPEEPEWEGFSSEENGDEEGDSVQRSEDDSEPSSNAEDDDSLSSNSDEANDSESSEESSSDGSESDENEDSENPKRSSAFKAWASEQINEALGYQPVSNIAMAIDTPKVAGVEPRAPEQDPLPAELQPTSNISRKAFSVTVNRAQDIQEARLKLPVVAEEQKIMEAIHNNNLVVVYGATGSGKTTQVLNRGESQL
jgi:ATP-dependent RNA helicase DHX37/DHR1